MDAEGIIFYDCGQNYVQPRGAAPKFILDFFIITGISKSFPFKINTE